MARLPHAATQLIKQVTEARPKSEAHREGDPDGLNVSRTIKFDEDTSAWLGPILAELRDPRIADSHVTEAGYLHVTFVPDRRADLRDPFPLEAGEVLATANAPAGDEPEQPKAAPKKRAAKKALSPDN